jgi:hypothetical protein
MIFKKKKPTPPTPKQRAFAAVDELNAALDLLREEEGYANIRVFVVSYNPSTRRRSHIVLGTWKNRAFDVLYEGANT